MVPGSWYRDRWTQQWVQVVYGAQAPGYVTVRLASDVVVIRTSDLIKGR